MTNPDAVACDLIVHNVTILTVDEQRRHLDTAHVAIRDGVIVAVAAGPPPSHLLGSDTEVLDGRGALVTPGLVSTHQHVIDVLLRGVSQERSLADWSYNVYGPGTTAYTPDDVRLAVLVAVDEALRSGITTIVDNWSASLDPSLADESAIAALEAYAAAGIRVQFGRMFSDASPAAWGAPMHDSEDDPVEDTDEALASIESLQRRYHGTGGGRISVVPAPAGAHYVSAAGLAGSLQLADRFDTVLTLHHCETKSESRIVTVGGADVTTTEHLDSLGILGPRLLAAHCVWLTPSDIRLLATTSTGVAHCPTSNMMLASGIAPVTALRSAGVVVGLGCDNAMLNNNVSLLGELRLAALLAKVSTGDPAAMTAESAIDMATRDGAAAIGQHEAIGSIEVGKKADLVLFDTSGSHWVPTHDPAQALVFQAHPTDARTVIIDGRVVMRDRVMSWLPAPAETHLFEAARRAARDIVERTGLRRFGPPDPAAPVAASAHERERA